MKRRSLFRRRIDDNEDSSDAINMTPLIDMVFILLIFFLVTTSFIRESTVAVQRPQAATAIPQKDSAVIVTISADEQVWLQNTVVDVRHLHTVLEQMNLTGTNPGAIIVADSRISTGLLIQVMDQLRMANFVNISVAANTGVNPP
jgi:biopolymer transport protein ExbD